MVSLLMQVLEFMEWELLEGLWNVISVQVVQRCRNVLVWMCYGHQRVLGSGHTV